MNTTLFFYERHQTYLNVVSSRVAGILNFLVNFKDVNVLEDDEIRQGIKDFSDWPTIPQLYVKNAFVGGSDIITEMTMSGELDQLFSEKTYLLVKMQQKRCGRKFLK